MGTTVTSNLGLIKPDLNESIKQALPTFQGWATQNQINSNKIDGLFRAAASTISLTFAASSGGWAAGAGGFTSSKVIRILPRMAICSFIVDMGNAGFTAGTGNYKLTGMNPTIDPIIDSTFGFAVPMGIATYYDSSAVVSCSVFGVEYDVTNKNMFFRCPDGTVWSNTNPVALGTLDRISGYFIYPTTDP